MSPVPVTPCAVFPYSCVSACTGSLRCHRARRQGSSANHIAQSGQPLRFAAAAVVGACQAYRRSVARSVRRAAPTLAFSWFCVPFSLRERRQWPWGRVCSGDFRCLDGTCCLGYRRFAFDGLVKDLLITCEVFNHRQQCPFRVAQFQQVDVATDPIDRKIAWN